MPRGCDAGAGGGGYRAVMSAAGGAPRAVTKAVVPAAGLGTRFLPATKAVPKELLPVVDIPAIEYVVAEAARAGLRDVLLVTSRGKEAVEDHFDAAPLLEAVLAAKGEVARLAAVRRSTEIARVHAVRQGEPLGLGHAVLQAAAHVGGEAFAVLLGDDLVDERDPLLETMLAVRAERGGSVVALMEVPAEQVGRYGVARVAGWAEQGAGAATARDVNDAGGRPAGAEGAAEVVEVLGLVEKPPPEQAPSRLAVIGRYVLDPEVFAVLRDTPPGRGGEIQLTDALEVLAARGRLRGVVFRGRRYDTGDRLEWLKAVVLLACEREDLGPPLRAWLRELAGGLAP